MTKRFNSHVLQDRVKNWNDRNHVEEACTRLFGEPMLVYIYTDAELYAKHEKAEGPPPNNDRPQGEVIKLWETADTDLLPYVYINQDYAQGFNDFHYLSRREFAIMGESDD